MINNFIYNVANTKSYGHIMVDVNDWHSDKIIMQVNLKGKLLPTFITKVIKINSAPAYRPVPFKEGDLVALSAIATRVGVLKPFKLPNDSNTYANVHLSQVLGYFQDGVIDINKFVPLYDKVVMRKIDIPASSSLQLISDSMSVGEVVSTGDGGFTSEWERRPMNIKVGSRVLVRDNVTTTLSINSDEFYVTDDSYVVGRFLDSKEYNIEDITLYDEDSTIFQEYISDRIEGSFLFRPVLDSDTDIAQSYQENYFTVVKTNKLDKNKIYFISKFDTEYTKFKGNTYFVAKNDKVMAYKNKEK
jgi:co-chaperonin GroES (HSP10)